MSRHVCIVLGALSLMGCVIPLAPDYQVPPNTPATVRGGRATPQDEVLIINLDTYPRSELFLDVEIEDPDVQQELLALVYVDFFEGEERPPPNSAFVTIAPAEGAVRTQQFRIPLTELTTGFDRATGCRSVAIRVNEEYGVSPPSTVLVPVPPEDEGVGTWFVALTSSAEPDVPVDSCNSRILTGEP